MTDDTEQRVPVIENRNATRRVHIESRGGIALGTRVLNVDGSPIPGVTRIVIDPLAIDGLVTATITVFASLDIEAEGSFQIECPECNAHDPNQCHDEVEALTRMETPR